MLRPSDVAPTAVYLDSDDGVLKNVVFSTKDVTFMDNGGMCCYSWKQKLL